MAEMVVVVMGEVGQGHNSRIVMEALATSSVYCGNEMKMMTIAVMQLYIII